MSSIVPNKQELKDTIQAWISEQDKCTVSSERYYEATTLLMMAKSDLLNTKGWNELEFWVFMLGYARLPTPSHMPGMIALHR